MESEQQVRSATDLIAELIVERAAEGHSQAVGKVFEDLHISDNSAWRRLSSQNVLTFRNCVFHDDVDLSFARVMSLSFTGCSMATPAHGMQMTRLSVSEDVLIRRCDVGWLDLSQAHVTGDITVDDVRIGLAGRPEDVANLERASLDLRSVTTSVIALTSVTTSDRVALFEAVASAIQISDSDLGVEGTNVHTPPTTVVLDNSSPTTFATLWLSQVHTRNSVRLGPGLTVHGDIRLVDASIGTALRIGADTVWATRTDGIPAPTSMTVIHGGLLNLLRARVGTRTELALTTTYPPDRTTCATPPIVLNDGSFADLSIFHLTLPTQGAPVCLDGAQYTRLNTPHLTRADGTSPTIPDLDELDVVRAYARCPAPEGHASPSLYLGQPYRELSQSLIRHGRTEEARKVLMRMHADERAFSPMARGRKMWNAILGSMIGYGYALQRSAIPLAACVVIAFCVVLSGKANDAFLATEPALALETIALQTTVSQQERDRAGRRALASSECTTYYPCLQPFVYTLDVLVPVVEFDQTRYWQPRGDWWGRALLIVLMGLSWVFVTLLVTGLSSVARHDHDTA